MAGTQMTYSLGLARAVLSVPRRAGIAGGGLRIAGPFLRSTAG